MRSSTTRAPSDVADFPIPLQTLPGALQSVAVSLSVVFPFFNSFATVTISLPSIVLCVILAVLALEIAPRSI